MDRRMEHRMDQHQPWDLHQPWEQSPQWSTLPRLIRAAAARHGDRLAVATADRELTFNDVVEASTQVARGLVAAGVEPGDRVAIWVENRCEWPVICLGAWQAGAVVVPVNTRLKGIETADILRRTAARVLFAVPSFGRHQHLALLREQVGGPDGDLPFAGLPALRTLVTVGEEAVEGALNLAQLVEGGAAVPVGVVAEREAAVAPEDPCEILFTSGTTGRPKGVVVDNAQTIRIYWDWTGIFELGPEDRCLLVSPYAHGTGVNAHLVGSLIRGFACVPVDVFDATTVLDLMVDRGVTVMVGPPSLYTRLLQASHDRKAPSLRLAALGMSTVPPELTARLREEWSVARIANAYGMTEAQVMLSTRPDDDDRTVSESSGRPLPGVELQLVDEAGQPVPPEERGEIVVRRSFAVMDHYWDDPDATAAAFDESGWFHTGDMAVADDRGNVRIIGRSKDVFIVNGFNAYPTEIENLLLHHTGIVQAAILAVPDDETGEAGVAFVVPDDGVDLDPVEIREWSRRSMATYKVPKHVLVVDDLPLGATGKVDRNGLADLFDHWSRQAAEA